jgi:Glycosyl transferase family 2
MTKQDTITALADAETAPRKVLFSAMKNEAPFILEWVAYHKVIGFDEIVICSNPSNDGTEDLLAALAEMGEVRHLRAVTVPGKSAQYVASIAFTREVGYRDGDWYMWLDGDEFLNIHAGDRTVNALIEAMAGKQCALINWRIFGASGATAFSGRFIDPAFPGAALPDFPAQLEQKAFFRFSPAIRGFARYGLHRPLIARNTTLQLSDVVTGNGKTPSETYRMHLRWLNGVDSGGTNRVPGDEFGWAMAQVNHYLVRTPEFFALKRLRGRGYKPDAAGATNNRHTPEFFAAHDRNEAEDRSILYWQDRVTEEVARLMRNPAVAQAAQRSAEMVKQILAELDTPTEPDTPTTKPAFQLTFPRAERAFVREVYPRSKVILEYGSGGSTVLAAESGCRVISVESDKAWAERLAAHLAPISQSAKIHYADIGRTGPWGMPAKPRQFHKFHGYALSVWDRPDFEEPDLVLIDGRFRAACLVAVLLRAKRPTMVLFDDYVDRSYYHDVEKLARKEEIIGRMARFTVTPGPIPPDMMTTAIGWFADAR